MIRMPNIHNLALLFVVRGWMWVTKSIRILAAGFFVSDLVGIFIVAGCWALSS